MSRLALNTNRVREICVSYGYAVDISGIAMRTVYKVTRPDGYGFTYRNNKGGKAVLTVAGAELTNPPNWLKSEFSDALNAIEPHLRFQRICEILRKHDWSEELKK